MPKGQSFARVLEPKATPDRAVRQKGPLEEAPLGLMGVEPRSHLGHRGAQVGADVFLFRDPPCTTAICTSPNLVVALSTQAVADPQFGSSYHFQENALYRLNFTTRKDADPTAHIDFVFGPFGNGPDCPTGPACQTYRAGFPNHVVIDGPAPQG